MDDELKNIEMQPVETQDVAAPDSSVPSVDTAPSVDTVPSADDKRRPWYYVKRIDRYIIKNFLGTFFFAIVVLN